MTLLPRVRVTGRCPRTISLPGSMPSSVPPGPPPTVTMPPCCRFDCFNPSVVMIGDGPGWCIRHLEDALVIITTMARLP